MSLQQIIDTSQKIVFDRRKVVGQTISRSQRIKSAQRNTADPLTLVVTPAAIYPYAAARDMVEGVMLNDRFAEFQIKLGNNNKTAYLNEYRGALTIDEAKGMTITNFTLNNVTIATNTSTTATVLKAGDWIQPVWSRYPYIVTQDAVANGSVVTATVHRNLITSENTTVTGTMLVGTDTTMRVLIAELPTYELVQHKFLSWSDDFTLIEKVI